MLVKPMGVEFRNFPGIKEGMKFKYTGGGDSIYESGVYTLDKKLMLSGNGSGWPLNGFFGEFTQVIEEPVDLFEYADYVEQNQKESA